MRAWTRGGRGTAVAVALAVLAGAGGVAVGVLLAQGPAEGGPLVGPRSEPGGIVVCAPAAQGERILVGLPLTNTSGAVVVLDSATVTSTGAAEAEVGIDVDGPGIGQLVGASLLGEDAVEPWVAEVVNRTVAPEGVEIPPGVTAALNVTLSAQDLAAGASVDRVELRYHQGGKDYLESVDVRLVIGAGGTCDAMD